MLENKVPVENVPSAAPETPADFLRQNPRGAYTAMRTWKRRAIVEWSHHLQRLEESARLMVEKYPELGKYAAPPSSVNDVQQIVMPLVRKVLRGFRKKDIEEGRYGRKPIPMDAHDPDIMVPPEGYLDELLVTVLLCPPAETSTTDTWRAEVHVCALHPPTWMLPVQVVVNGPPRHLATAKDSEWARERQSLERIKPRTASEMILTKSGQLLEGLVSNFFIVTGSNKYESDLSQVMVFTAPITPMSKSKGGVLAGIARGAVLHACDDLGIAVYTEAPTLENSSDWTEAFLTGTGKLVQPINIVNYDRAAITLPYARGPITKMLGDWVAAHINEASSDDMV